MQKSIYGKGAVAKLPDQGYKKVIAWRAEGKSLREIQELISEVFSQDLSHSAVYQFFKHLDKSRTGIVAKSEILQRQQASEFFDLVSSFKNTNEHAEAMIGEVDAIMEQAKKALNEGKAGWKDVSGLFRTKIQLLDHLTKQIKLNAQMIGKLEQQRKVENKVQINVVDLAPKIGRTLEVMKVNKGLYCGACKSTNIKYRELTTKQIVEHGGRVS
jgi:DNA-binding transcriptional MerR regulator